LVLARTVIFVNTKRQCDAVDDFLFNKNFPCTSIHGDRTQREREDALIAFRTGVTPILIATDVAARGIDVKGVMHGKKMYRQPDHLLIYDSCQF